MGDAARRCGRTPGVLWRRTLDGALVLLPDTVEPLELSPTAALIWGELTEPRDVETLIMHLAARFNVDRGRVAAEVDALLDELEAKGAVRCPA